MSFQALAWAAKQRPGNLAAKMILFGLANWADEHGCAYPSTAALAEFGDMDHKTATSALHRLVDLGLISDSGQRAGHTRQIKVYQLNLESPPKTEGFRKRKASVFPIKDPQKRGTDTITDTTSVAKATSVARTRAKAVFKLPDWVPAEAWAAFVEMRRATPKVAFTDTAKKGIVAELEKLRAQGHDPGSCLLTAVTNGWRSVFAPRHSTTDNPGGRTVSDIDRELGANFGRLQAGKITEAEFEQERARLDRLERKRIAAGGREAAHA